MHTRKPTSFQMHELYNGYYSLICDMCAHIGTTYAQRVDTHTCLRVCLHIIDSNTYGGVYYWHRSSESLYVAM